jgi:hypothetical protein
LGHSQPTATAAHWVKPRPRPLTEPMPAGAVLVHTWRRVARRGHTSHAHGCEAIDGKPAAKKELILGGNGP